MLGHIEVPGCEERRDVIEADGIDEDGAEERLLGFEGERHSPFGEDIVVHGIPRDFWLNSRFGEGAPSVRKEEK